MDLVTYERGASDLSLSSFYVAASPVIFFHGFLLTAIAFHRHAAFLSLL